MLSLAAVNRSWLCSSLLTLLGILGFPLSTLRGEDGKGIEEIQAINSQWDKAVIKAVLARRKAKSPIELEHVQNDLSASEHRLVEQCMDLARRQPDSTAGLIALKSVACRAPKTEEGKKAVEVLIRQAASAELDVLANLLYFSINASGDPINSVMPIILERVKRNLGHPQAARLLATVVSGSADRGAMKPSPVFIEAANLIVERYADSPDARGLCEMLGSLSESQTWPAAFEKHLRTILVRNQGRAVRAAASYSLASVVALAGESRQGEAEKLYEEAIKKFDGSEDSFFAGIEKEMTKHAQYKLAELKAIGKPAPEIEGIDLDGRAMKLSDYRGKVVLVSFWATWCGPCMKMIPHERKLVARFEGKPFVIVGVNGDDDQQASRDAAAQNGMTWRSFQDRHGGQTISLAWHVWGWPTFYLIDQSGVIRKRWNDTQPEALDQSIHQLIGVPTESKTTK
jgi:thiol-disulfide isomerase/thioredoxin